MAVQNRLKTRCRLLEIGLSNDDSCYLCMQRPENIQHLFFECDFSKNYMQKIMMWLGIRWGGENLSQSCRWIRSRLAGNQFKKQVGLIAIAAVVYKIWN